MIEMLRDSAKHSLQFTGATAAQALNVLASIVHNLITRPEETSWRTLNVSEVEQICTTRLQLWMSAFTFVRSVLIGFERILGVIGYRTLVECDEGAVVRLPTEHTQADDARLLSIYQDLIVASMECAVWQEVYDAIKYDAVDVAGVCESLVRRGIPKNLQ